MSQTDTEITTADANMIAAHAQAMIVACAFATSGSTKDAAQSVIVRLWTSPQFAFENSGIHLTFAMMDEILNEAFKDRWIDCPYCEGHGSVHMDGCFPWLENCPTCCGTGSVQEVSA